MRPLRDYLPKGLYWRTYLIIILPVAVMQLLIAGVYLDSHWRATSKRLAQLAASEAATLTSLYEAAPGPAQLAWIRRLGQRTLRMNIQVEEGAALAGTHCFFSLSPVSGYLPNFLSKALSRPVWYDASCPGRRAMIRVPIQNGVLVFEPLKSQVQAGSWLPFLLWVLAATAALLTVSILFIRNQVKPVQQLAHAMHQFGLGAPLEDYRPRGAREVREAGGAFLAMRTRITRHLEQRAQLLAGVSHDLRTPLTRLRLHFAMHGSKEENAPALADLADLENTLEEYLAFARGQWLDELEEVDLAVLTKDIVQHVHSSSETILVVSQACPPILGRRNALKRCIANLIDNAIAHGETVRVTIATQAQTVCVQVEDDGPGLPASAYEAAFTPFSRLDSTRSRNIKGVGLGLAIARDVARGHGGDIVLSASALGGLRAVLSLPIGAVVRSPPQPRA